jgi:hypothetical protein
LGVIFFVVLGLLMRLRSDSGAGSYSMVRQAARASGRHFARSVLRAGRSFLLEFWRFSRVRENYWLLPVLLMMVVFGGLIVLTQEAQWRPNLLVHRLAKAADLFSPHLSNC